MKRTTSLLVLSVLMSSAPLLHARVSRNKTKENLKQLRVNVKNATDETLETVTATFKFIGPNELDQPSLEAQLSIQDLKKDTGVFLDSDDALYHGKTAKNFFTGPYHVVLTKLYVGRWRIKGTDWMLRSAKLKFKDGTQKKDFVVVRKKGRFGFPSLVIQPVVNKAVVAG